MSEKLGKISSRKNPPDKKSTGSHAIRLLRQARALSWIALLVLLQQVLILGVRAVCSDPTSLTAPSAPSSYTYTIGSGPYSWTVGAWTQDTDCTYTETLTMSPTASWISISGRTIKVVTTDTSLHGTSTSFTVTTTLDDTDGTNDNSYTFTIVLSNPCRTATLESPTVSNISVDDGSSATATFTDVGDTYSTDYGNIAFCGARTCTFGK